MIRYLPETFKIFCNMAVSLSNWLSRKIEQSSISDKAKLVLFGLASPTPIQDFAKKSAPKPEKTLQADYDEIQRRLTLWLESPGSLASDPTAADLADRLGIPQRQLKAFFQFHLGRNFRTWKSEIKMTPSVSGTMPASTAYSTELWAARPAFGRQPADSPTEKIYSALLFAELSRSGHGILHTLAFKGTDVYVSGPRAGE